MALTIVGRQRHPDGLVGKLWRIQDPETVQIGDCFLKGRLLYGDLFLCTKHSGDCFQTYVYVKEYANKLVLHREWFFGSYGIGDAVEAWLSLERVAILCGSGYLELECIGIERIT